MLRGFKRIRPEIHLKCFTAVEIAFFADLYGKTDEQVLRELQEAGLDSLPGGGAEIFAERVRKKICDDKCGADRYLAIHRLAHRLGMRTNITMLYGHIETVEERVDHMLRARDLQDDTGGLQAFIPLAFHPDNNQMRKLPAPERGRDVARPRRLATDARQRSAHQGVLDRDRRRNGSVGLWFGADDLDGTVQEEHIYHMAGSKTPEGMTTKAIRRLIRDAGREPYERETLYNVITGPERGLASGGAGLVGRTFRSGDHMDIRLLNQVEKQSIGERQPIPENYLRLSDDEMDARIEQAKRTLGERLVILGHHYQRDEVIKFADFIGDSLKLAKAAATRHTAEYIVFCGVHFMAESADILRGPNQKVVLPDLAAGCSMADMAGEDQLEPSPGASWPRWASTSRPSSPSPTSIRRRRLRPSSASTAASSAPPPTPPAVMKWAWERGEKLLMLPDQHLGRNTAYKIGCRSIDGGLGSARGRRRSYSTSRRWTRSCCCGRGTAPSTRASRSRRSRRSGRSIPKARSSRTRNARSTSSRPPT